jgi:tetratricopeptide (TPR) repeat protein
VLFRSDWIPFNNLANDDLRVGNAEAAITAGQQALSLNPNHGFPYSVLSLAYQWANRFAEAKAVGEKAKAAKLDNWTLHRVLYVIALMEKDEQSAQRESDWAEGNPLEGLLIYQKAMYMLSLGRVREARGIFDRARALALERQPKELAAALIQDEAQDTADLGFSSEARNLANTARSMLPTGSERNGFTALALARAGDSSRAEALAEEGAKARPTDLLANNVTIASVR